jgi:hypothetical protein
MTRHLLVALSTCFALAACGPEEYDPPSPPPPVVQPPPPPPPAISPDFNGRWVGDSVVCAPGQGCVTNPGVSFAISASGQTLTASGFCPDGSGVLTVTGQSGRSLSWDGSVVCNYASSCPTTRNEYVHATLTLDSSNTLSLVAYANLSGCGYAFATTTTFTGRK